MDESNNEVVTKPAQKNRHYHDRLCSSSCSGLSQANRCQPLSSKAPTKEITWTWFFLVEFCFYLHSSYVLWQYFEIWPILGLPHISHSWGFRFSSSLRLFSSLSLCASFILIRCGRIIRFWGISTSFRLRFRFGLTFSLCPRFFFTSASFPSSPSEARLDPRRAAFIT